MYSYEVKGTRLSGAMRFTLRRPIPGVETAYLLLQTNDCRQFPTFKAAYWGGNISRFVVGQASLLTHIWRRFSCNRLRVLFQLDQAFCISPGRTSAGMRKPQTKARIILRLRLRCPERTSETRLRLPRKGPKSLLVRPCCAMRKRIAATGSGLSIGKTLPS